MEYSCKNRTPVGLFLQITQREMTDSHRTQYVFISKIASRANSASYIGFSWSSMKDVMRGSESVRMCTVQASSACRGTTAGPLARV